MHAGKSLAAELSGEATVGSGLIGLQADLGDHAGHGVNLTAELGDEKLFITPEEVSRECTGTPTGTTS